MDAGRSPDDPPGDQPAAGRAAAGPDDRAVAEVRRRLRAAGWSVGKRSLTSCGVRLTFRRRRHGSGCRGQATFTARGGGEAEAYYNVLLLIAWGEVPGVEDGDAPAPTLPAATAP